MLVRRSTNATGLSSSSREHEISRVLAYDDPTRNAQLGKRMRENYTGKPHSYTFGLVSQPIYRYAPIPAGQASTGRWQTNFRYQPGLLSVNNADDIGT